MTATFQIPLDSIIIDKKLQPRMHGLDPDHLGSLRNSEPSTWPPIMVTQSDAQTGKRVLIDGAHRLTVAKEKHLSGLHATELADSDKDVWKLRAYEANMTHGLPLSNAEKKAYAKLLIERHGQSKSQHEYARLSGLSVGTINSLVTGNKPVQAYSRLKEEVATLTTQVEQERRTVEKDIDHLIQHIENSMIYDNLPAQYEDASVDALQSRIEKQLEAYEDQENYDDLLQALQMVGMALYYAAGGE